MKTKSLPKVEQFHAKNQFIITEGSKTIFQSYGSIIAVNENGRISLDAKYWDYSNATSKYRNLFLGENKQETEKKIKNGVYKLSNLN